MNSYFTNAIELDALLANLPPGFKPAPSNIIRGTLIENDNTLYGITEGREGLLLSVLDGPGNMDVLAEHFELEEIQA